MIVGEGDDMDRIMSRVALVISLIAVGLVANAHFHAEHMAERALQQREQIMIDRMWPTMKAIYQDLFEGSERYTAEKPETIEELFRPLFTVVGEIGG